METDKKTTDTTSASTPPEAEVVDVQNKTESVAAPKTITLKKNDKGIWKALNISSVVVGPSKLPAKTAEKDDL